MITTSSGAASWAKVVGALILGLLSASCSRTTTEPQEAPRNEEAPPEPIEVRSGQQNLLFTFKDPETARFRTVETVEDVPEEARSAVVATDLRLPPEVRGSERYLHVADLREPTADGTYPVAVASRYGFEQQVLGASVTGQGSDSTAPVVVYSTSWCGVCKKAKRVLAELGVSFVEKDIEASRSALEELQVAASAAELQPGGVPVISVKGTLLQGLDVPRLKAVLRDHGLLGGS